MGQKLFSNKTKYDLDATLIVRQGDTPGHEAGTKKFVIPAMKDMPYTYSNGSDPYLDGVAVTTKDPGGAIGAKVRVITRGGSVDNALNTNSSIVFTQQDESLLLAFHN
ncbi:MAG TPA: hypothetical protein VGD01_18025 [Candidatus Elarobacter sp.]|jgi:hypothetical protein